MAPWRSSRLPPAPVPPYTPARSRITAAAPAWLPDCPGSVIRSRSDGPRQRRRSQARPALAPVAEAIPGAGHGLPVDHRGPAAGAACGGSGLPPGNFPRITGNIPGLYPTPSPPYWVLPGGTPLSEVRRRGRFCKNFGIKKIVAKPRAPEKLSSPTPKTHTKTGKGRRCPVAALPRLTGTNTAAEVPRGYRLQVGFKTIFGCGYFAAKWRRHGITTAKIFFILSAWRSQARRSDFFIFLCRAPGSFKRHPGAHCNRAVCP